MQQQIALRLLPSEAADDAAIKLKIANAAGRKCSDVHGYQTIKRSIDARGKNVLINLTVKAFIDEPFIHRKLPTFNFRDCSHAKQKVIIIGAGPAGLFAALTFLEAGIQPVILERGKDVKSRRRDLAKLNREGLVHPDSNYCFGEGGAGTYSDGKLYTRSNKRGDINRILSLFAMAGAPEQILYDAHPHIGTNKLPAIITYLRNLISECGGKVLFEKKVTDIESARGQINSVITEAGDKFSADAFILATGHSARDIFELLMQKKILIEAKPFALGVRVEHPQSFIDSRQYHQAIRSDLLPPASYSLVEQVEDKGVFSFCMCPGGIIAPAATSPGEVVVNGWSPSKRNNPFANSGIVVTITAEDAWKSVKHLKIEQDDPLLFMHFQKLVEQKAFVAGGSNLSAPAQRMTDFCNKKLSVTLPSNSYLPGLSPARLDNVLPYFVFDVLAKGFKAFDKKMRGYYTDEANVVATESRTSSPVRIPRDAQSYQHPQFENLYPCGEGAGYAGGIVSAAMDGENVASAIVKKLLR